jgi:hypothetical protein
MKPNFKTIEEVSKLAFKSPENSRPSDEGRKRKEKPAKIWQRMAHSATINYIRRLKSAVSQR